MVVKLKDGEARHLADLLQNVARPQPGSAEAKEVEKWIKRLRGVS